jgi:hypothetical protein
LQCHGPDGLGSSYAPSLVDSLKTLSDGDLVSTVVSGKKEVNTAQQQVMPSFGTNKNVTCYIDAIYVYLRARSDGALNRQRPEKHTPKTDAYTKAEDSCMGWAGVAALAQWRSRAPRPAWGRTPAANSFALSPEMQLTAFISTRPFGPRHRLPTFRCEFAGRCLDRGSTLVAESIPCAS